MKRRSYLLTMSTAGSLVLAGCLDEGDGDSEPSEYEFELETVTDVLEDSGIVESGEFEAFTLSVPVATQMSCTVEVTSGPAITFLTMNQNEFNRYRDGDQFSFFEDLSVESSRSVNVSGELLSGEYRLLIDRTGVEFH